MEKNNRDIKFEIENVFVDIQRKTDYKNNKNKSSYLINYKNIFHTIYEIIFHLYILILFEILFYIFFIIKVEKKEIIKLIVEFSNYIKQNIQNNVDYIVINNYFQYIRSESMIFCNSITNDYKSKKNIELRELCFIFIYVNTTIFFFMNICHYCLYKSLSKIAFTFTKIIMFLIFCGCFEYLFFILIISKYKIITKEESLCILLSNMN